MTEYCTSAIDRRKLNESMNEDFTPQPIIVPCFLLLFPPIQQTSYSYEEKKLGFAFFIPSLFNHISELDPPCKPVLRDEQKNLGRARKSRLQNVDRISLPRAAAVTPNITKLSIPYQRP